MDDQTKSFWWKIWGRPVRFFLWLTGLLLLLYFVSAGHDRVRLDQVGVWRVDKPWTLCALICGMAAVVSVFFLVLSLIRPTRPLASWILRRWFFCAAVLATVVALFYAEENWRGKRVWEKTKHDIEASGAVLNWDEFIPPPVPDDQNIFKAPKMEDWFVKDIHHKLNSNELTVLLRSPTNFPVWGSTNNIQTEADARAYLAWSDQLQPQFNLIRDALKRPYARMDGDYSQMMVLPFPNFVAVREVARVLAQRSHCYLLLHQPDKALAELALIHDLRHLLEAAPSGKPMTLVGAMINVAVAGLYVDVIGGSFRLHAWKDEDLAELEKQLSEIHLMIPVAAAFQAEPAATTRTLETVPISQVLKEVGPELNLLRIAPRGWVFQNLAQQTPFLYSRLEGLDAALESVSPRPLNEAQARMEKFLSHRSPYNILARLMLPNVLKAIQTTARNQSLVNEARVACALERYKLAHGQYPDSLDALAPQFIEKIPHDVINDGQLKYRRSDDGFVLYSVGWNEKDDGGAQMLTDDGRSDWINGDLVWNYSRK